MSNDSQTSLSDQLQRDIEEMEARSTSKYHAIVQTLSGLPCDANLVRIL